MKIGNQSYHRWIYSGIIFMVSMASLAISPPASMLGHVEGIWEGVLSVAGSQLRVVFKISSKPDGILVATMDSPDQGAKDIPVDSVLVDGANVRLVMTLAAASYSGTVALDGKSMEGKWLQGGMSLPLAFQRTEKALEIKRPQTPVKPYPYHDEDVSYDNKDAAITIAGTLTMPKTGGPFPAALLITGSGPQDRNESLLGHQPFFVLADYLTRQGIAVLRVDDRGVGKSTGHFATATTRDFANDVLAGIAYLKTRKEIDPGQIGLVGHSEGGIIGPMVAAQSTDVAFVVMMAGTGLKGEDILYLQGDLIGMAAKGATKEAVAKNHALQKRLFSVIKQESDTAAMKTKLRSIFDDAVSSMAEVERKAPGFSQAAIDGQIKSLLSPWFRYFLTYDPKPVLMELKCAVLAINGEKDLQVPPGPNLAVINKALMAGGNKHFTTLELTGLNHLFQTAKTGSPEEYATIEETMSPTAMKTIGDWILSRTK